MVPKPLFPPICAGVGFASVAVSCILMIYYSVVIAWGMRFLIASLTDSLPWVECDSCDCLLYSRNLTDIEDYDNFLFNNSYGLNCSKFSIFRGWIDCNFVLFSN